MMKVHTNSKTSLNSRRMHASPSHKVLQNLDYDNQIYAGKPSLGGSKAQRSNSSVHGGNKKNKRIII
jgi:hypothetical protein